MSSKKPPPRYFGGYLDPLLIRDYRVNENEVLLCLIKASSDACLANVSDHVLLEDIRGRTAAWYDFPTVYDYLIAYTKDLKLNYASRPPSEDVQELLTSLRNAMKCRAMKTPPLWFMRMLCYLRRNMFSTSDKEIHSFATDADTNRRAYFFDDLFCASILLDGYVSFLSDDALKNEHIMEGMANFPKYMQDICQVEKVEKYYDKRKRKTIVRSRRNVFSTRSKYGKHQFESAMIYTCKKYGLPGSGEQHKEVFQERELDEEGNTFTRNVETGKTKFTFITENEPRLLRISRMTTIVVFNMLSQSDYSEFFSIFSCYAIHKMAYLFHCSSDYLSMKQLNRKEFKISKEFQEYWSRVLKSYPDEYASRDNIYPKFKPDLNAPTLSNPYEGDFLEDLITVKAIKQLLTDEKAVSKPRHIVSPTGFWNNEKVQTYLKEHYGVGQRVDDVIRNNLELYRSCCKVEKTTVGDMLDLIIELFEEFYACIAQQFQTMNYTVPLMSKILQRRFFDPEVRSLVRSPTEYVVYHGYRDDKVFVTMQEFKERYLICDSRLRRSRAFCFKSPNADKYFEAISSDENLKKFLLGSETIASLYIEGSTDCDCCDMTTPYYRKSCKNCTDCERFEVTRDGDCLHCGCTWRDHNWDFSWISRPEFFKTLDSFPILTLKSRFTYGL